jgi:hypothetical protein
MINLNKNHSLNALQEIVKNNINQRLDYMPDSFNEQQRYALELFNKRLFLEEVIEETISFNKKIVWENRNENLKLTRTAEEMIKVFQLRSEVYTEIGYQSECPDTIEGLNFDKHDKNSAIIYYEYNNEITGTLRFIFDSKNKLPSEGVMPFDEYRSKYKSIGELSRNIVRHNKGGLGQEFKYLMNGVHNVFTNNDVDMTLSGIRKDHYRMCSKFGGINIIKEISSYGEVDLPFLIISWDLNSVSPFFKKAFLR